MWMVCKLKYPKTYLSLIVLSITLFFGCETPPPPPVKEVIVEVDSTAYFVQFYAPLADKIDSFFSHEHAKTQFFGNVLFAENGRTFFSKCYSYQKPKTEEIITLDHTFQLASVSKTFTAVATLMLVENGLLNLEDTIQKFIPEFPYRGITIHHLLSHRSGLSKYTHFCDNPDTVWTDKSCSIYNNDVVQIINKILPAIVSRPGRRFYYANTNYVLLASIIEKISQLKFQDFLTENIFKPLEMESTRVYYRDNYGELVQPVKGYEANYVESIDIYLNGCMGDKGIYSNLEDMLKYDQALYNEKLLKNETLALAFTGYSKNDRSNNNSNYGYGFRMMEIEGKGKIIYHNGWWKGFRTYFIRVVEKKQTIIILTNVKRGQFLKVQDLVTYLPD